jgi:hypothetical protein
LIWRGCGIEEDLAPLDESELGGFIDSIVDKVPLLLEMTASDESVLGQVDFPMASIPPNMFGEMHPLDGINSLVALVTPGAQHSGFFLSVEVVELIIHRGRLGLSTVISTLLVSLEVGDLLPEYWLTFVVDHASAVSNSSARNSNNPPDPEEPMRGEFPRTAEP